MNDSTPVLEVHDLTVSYFRKPVLWSVDFAMPEGKMGCILGPNGSGKTTLLKAVLNLIEPASGYVRLFGQELNKVRNRIAYVPQRESVDWDFPTTVEEVVKMGRYGKLGLFGKLGKEDYAQIDQAIEKVGLSAFRKRQIGRLSGGQQQRVFLARALAQQAEFYLLDEPFAAVDISTEESIITLLKEMQAAGRSIICVHHDLQTVERYFDWAVLLNLRMVAAGEVKDVFTPEILQQTYGGRLSVLTQMTERVAEGHFPIREKRI